MKFDINSEKYKCLTGHEVQEKLKKYGYNELSYSKSKNIISVLFEVIR